MAAFGWLAPQLREALAERDRASLEIEGFRRAAVLVPLLDGPKGLELLFTVRGERMPHHAGQIAFPGGRLEEAESIEDAAVRETAEEVGLSVERAELLGRLDDHPSPARYVVTPVVAILPWPQPVRPDPFEVSEIFSVPLVELLSLVPRWEERQLEGLTRRIHFYSWGERLIWGFTGNVVKDLLEVLPNVRDLPTRASLDA